MILPLIAVFCIGAAASVFLAQSEERFSIWAAAFVNLLIALNELSFAFRPVAEWIRVDLLLFIPLFALVSWALAIYAWQSEYRPLAAVLGGNVLVIPLVFLITR